MNIPPRKKEKKNGGWSFFRGIVTGLGIAVSAGIYVFSERPFYAIEMAFDGPSAVGLSEEGEGRVNRAMQRFAEALVLAEEYHVAEDLDGDMVSKMLGGALSQLDQHSNFMNARATTMMTTMGDEEEAPRLGVTIMDVDGHYMIESVMPGSPAEIVGLMPGDRVVRVGDRFVGDEDPKLVNQVIHDEISANDGAEIRLGVRRPGKPREVSIVIDPEPVDPVGAHNLGRKDGVVHIHLERFYEGASDDVASIIRREMRQGGLDGVILDLRNNGGGLTSEVRRLASLFLPRNTLLYEMTGRVIGVETILSEVDPEFPDMGLSVIINGYSASSSEIMAAAIQAHKRGKILGWKSLGKGTVQRVYPVEDGAIKITVAEYRDGGLRSINGIGVEPDISFDGPDPHYRPSRFSKDEVRERARSAAMRKPYVASQ
jgi:carboxyl-terminal processing protease